MERWCDIFVLGSGAAGATAAVVSVAGGANTLVATFPTTRVQLGECLAPDGRRLLARIHGGHQEECHAPYVGSCSRWASDRMEEKSLLFHPAGSGLRLDRSAFDAQLLDSVRGAGADIFEASRILSAEQVAGVWQIELRVAESSARVRAAQIIDCTGRRGLFLRNQKVPRRQLDRLVAIVQTAPGACEDGRLSLEATPYGWWYRVVGPDGTEIVTLMTDSDLARSMGLRKSGRFAELFHGTLLGGRHRLRALVESQPVSVAGSTSIPETVVGNGWSAAGDAASTYDPLSSEGIQKAILGGRDAARAALSGNPAHYEEAWRAGFADYLRLRAAHYAANDRWKDEPFWARRRAV